MARAALNRITRRSAMVGVASTLPAMVAGASAAAGDDAGLLALGWHFDAITETLSQVSHRFTELFELHSELSPAKPDTMRARREDAQMFDLGKGGMPAIDDNGYYLPGAIEALRGRKFVRTDARSATPADGLCPDVITIISRVPWPEASARATEIVVSYDTWMAGRDALAREMGFCEAEDQLGRVQAELFSIERKILAEPAATIGGLIVKARVAEWNLREDNTDDALSWRCEVAWSIVDDLLRLAESSGYGRPQSLTIEAGRE
jgi:hypothetical protein